MMQGLVATLMALGCGAVGASGQEIHVSPDAAEGGDGTAERPLRLEAAAARLRPGDVCVLRGGRYRRTLVLDGLKGEPGRPIVFRAAPGPAAVLDGTMPVEGPWVQVEGRIYSKRLDADAWQLFVDGRPADLARFPDASLLDGSVWDMQTSMLRPDRATETELDCAALAGRGTGFTGAVAVLAVGHWLTYARPVAHHDASRIEYEARLEGAKGQDVTVRRYPYFSLLGRACLDRPNEWWFDSRTKTAFLWAPGGRDPVEAGPVEARVRDYGLVVRGSSDLRFEGLELFACAPFVDRSERIRFEGCRFRYPSEHKFVLGRFEWFSPHRSSPDRPGNNMFVLREGREYALVDCVVEYCNSPVGLLAEGIRVENCLFHDIEWDVNSDGGSGSVWVGAGARAVRNTIHTCGNSEGLRPRGPGAEIAWNHLYRMGLMQIDGAAINCGMQAHRGLAVHHNWVHDSNREAVRMDYPDADGLHPDGVAGCFAYNVMWNSQLPMVKGDRNLVYNNVSFHHHRHGQFGGGTLAGERDLGIPGFRKIHSGVVFNENTVARNNIARLGHFLGKDGDRLPCREDHNLNVPGAALAALRDPFNRDFRPKPDSGAVDGGAPVREADRPSPETPVVAGEVLGPAPDIGAYEHGTRNYWIPGRVLPHASTPVPPDGAEAVRPDADLMFLGGRGATGHVVYMGDAPDRLEKKAELVDTNVFPPGKLESGRSYHWRVDAVREGETVRGPIWRFKVR